MGFLDRVKKAVVPDFDELPRPGGDVGGVPGRALVVSEVSNPYGSDLGGRTNSVVARYVNADLELRRLDGDDRIVEVRAYVGQRAAQVLRRGMEVPVRVDPGSGVILGLDAELWEAEAEVIFAREAAQGGPAYVPPEASEVPDMALAGAAPGAYEQSLRIDAGDPALAPISGVDFETFVAIEVALQSSRVFRPDDQEAQAVARGVAPGTWAAASKGWNKRVRKDRRLAGRLGAAHAEAQAAADQDGG